MPPAYGREPPAGKFVEIALTINRGKPEPPRLSGMARETGDEKQQGQSDSDNAVRPNRTTACRPREQQDIEEGPEFIRPKQPCQSEPQTQLDNEAQPQNIHRDDSNERLSHWSATGASKESYVGHSVPWHG
jgi:hypothetical protein